ncbi:ribosome maturation factor RimM [Candidatus Pandoraea novymonadis]|uniref:Ribosome maturation factor RimM n=1 Tax=Candidatus Pandoraea novymonadis TaxID=1808959 RepID=A0ABX5FFR8_9BURK|nr:ribosome maturation factor RimM [Candidatus Pandoraea novymonadis]PSB92097.1 Ribosome maturation factor RimM [Candidatus Pandoraea novymonadis]
MKNRTELESVEFLLKRILHPVINVPTDLIELGYISGAHGIFGSVKVRPHIGQGDCLLSAKKWYCQVPGKVGWFLADILRSSRYSSTIVAQLCGVVNRTEAGSLKGIQLWVSRVDFPMTEEGEFYWVDLIGANVTNLQGQDLGNVASMLDNGIHSIMRVVHESSIEDIRSVGVRERLIPFVKHYVQSVDMAKRRIVVDWGLNY